MYDKLNSSNTIKVILQAIVLQRANGLFKSILTDLSNSFIAYCHKNQGQACETQVLCNDLEIAAQLCGRTYYCKFKSRFTGMATWLEGRSLERHFDNFQTWSLCMFIRHYSLLMIEIRFVLGHLDRHVFSSRNRFITCMVR